MSKLTYIFVHGLSGWGSYDSIYVEYPPDNRRRSYVASGRAYTQTRHTGVLCEAAGYDR